jgi:hypothetical protein
LFLVLIALALPTIPVQAPEVGRIQSAGWAYDGQGSALAVDGDTLAVGASFGRSYAIDGSVTIHERDPVAPTGWREVQRLEAPGYGTIDRFGDSLDLDGDVLAVGAWREDLARGAVYLFERMARLESPLEGAGQRFGYSLDLDGDRLLIGAPRGAPPPNPGWLGRAYVFERDPCTGAWLQSADLAFVPQPSTFQANFGYRVALDGDLALVTTYYLGFGIAMEVDVFRLRDGIWELRQRLSERDVGGGGSQSYFGIAIVLRGDQLYVMDPDRQLVHVFARTPAGPTEFEWSSSIPTEAATVLAVGDGRVAVGQPFQTTGVHVYERRGATWLRVARLEGSNPIGSRSFGRSILLEGERVLVGDPGLPGPTQPEVGGVRIFEVRAGIRTR